MRADPAGAMSRVLVGRHSIGKKREASCGRWSRGQRSYSHSTTSPTPTQRPPDTRHLHSRAQQGR
eukprot:2667149-Prymnesium_polylepis.1